MLCWFVPLRIWTAVYDLTALTIQANTWKQSELKHFPKGKNSQKHSVWTIYLFWQSLREAPICCGLRYRKPSLCFSQVWFSSQITLNQSALGVRFWVSHSPVPKTLAIWGKKYPQVLVSGQPKMDTVLLHFYNIWNNLFSVFWGSKINC